MDGGPHVSPLANGDATREKTRPNPTGPQLAFVQPQERDDICSRRRLHESRTGVTIVWSVRTDGVGVESTVG